MTKAELKTVKAGDIVYDKNGRKYEVLEVCRYQVAFFGSVNDLYLKPCDGGDNVYINSKRVKR